MSSAKRCSFAAEASLSPPNSSPGMIDRRDNRHVQDTGRDASSPLSMTTSIFDLPVNILLSLQPFHIIFQIGFVGIRRPPQRHLYFLHRIVKVSLSAVNTSQAEMRRPIVREFLGGRAIDQERLFLFLFRLQLPRIKIELQRACYVQRLGAKHFSILLAIHSLENF